MAIKYLTLFVTARCDSNCVMCFNYKPAPPDPDELSLWEYEKIAANLKRGLRSLLISGGEPSLREDLPEICGAFYKHCNVKKIYLPLNGHNKERTVKSAEKILQLCPGSLLNAGLSIDGVGKIHDKQRGVEGSFNKVMATYDALTGLAKRHGNLKRGIITVVTKMNAGGLEELADYIYNLPVRPDYHDIMACRIQAGARTARELLITPEEYKKVLNIADRYAYYYCRKRHNAITGAIAYLRHKGLNYIYLNAYKNRRIILCKAPEITRVIEPDGRVRICELRAENGNIRDYDYNLSKMERALKLSSEKADCACTHPCFVVPSLSSSLFNIFRLAQSVIADKMSFKKGAK